MTDGALSTAELDVFRQALLSNQAEMLEQEATFSDSGQTVELDQAKLGRLSRMDAMQAQQMALQGARRRQQQLQAIGGALQRIESGEYGDCYLCGEPIGRARLSIDPTATRCLGCAEQ